MLLPESPTSGGEPERVLPEWVGGPLLADQVSRTALVNRLRAARSHSVAAIVAPAGYGKTVLLAQWAARDERPFVYVSIEPDLDARELVGRLAAALGEAGSIDGPGRATPPGEWIWRTAIPQLASALRSIETPFVLVLDDAHCLDGDAADVVTALIQHVPPGSMVAVAGRVQPFPSAPRLRVSGELMELGIGDVAFTPRETRASLQLLLGCPVTDTELDEVFERTEGWPAGVRLAGLSLHRRDGAPPRRAAASAGNLTEYVEAECMAGLTPEQRTFLRRSSVLGRMCGRLCDAVLEREGSVGVLAALEQASVFLVALDREREWFRCHRAVHKQLRRELAEQEPWLVPELERRAAAWFEAGGDAERALRHWYAAGSLDEVARIIDSLSVEMHNDGRDEALAGWLALLERGALLEDHPNVAALAARLHAQHGEASEAWRCLDAAVRGTRIRTPDRDGQAVKARIELVRAAMCADGVEPMLVDTEHALDHLPPNDDWRPFGLLLQGTAYALLGETGRADPILSRAVHASTRLGLTETGALAATQRALLAADEGDRVRAGRLLDDAVGAIRSSGLETYATSALTLAAAARFEFLHGHSPEAFRSLASARALLIGLGGSLPWLAVQTRLELAAVDVTLRDAPAAGFLLAEVDELLAACPKLGVLRRRRDQLAAEIAAVPTSKDGRSLGLTAAELRLVPMLATHLSFREIGARFFLSRNTVKTQAISVYRKLGASSRSAAVARAQDLGLIDEPAGADGLVRIG